MHPCARTVDAHTRKSIASRIGRPQNAITGSRRAALFFTFSCTVLCCCCCCCCLSTLETRWCCVSVIACPAWLFWKKNPSTCDHKLKPWQSIAPATPFTFPIYLLIALIDFRIIYLAGPKVRKHSNKAWPINLSDCRCVAAICWSSWLQFSSEQPEYKINRLSGPNKVLWW